MVPPSGDRSDALDSATKPAFRLEAEPAIPKASLLVLHGRSLGKLQALGEGVLLLGRSEEAGMVLDDDGVSRKHARIEKVDGGYVIADLGSKNGVFVNGERVLATELKDGDRILIGTGTLLKFQLQDPLEEAAQRKLYELATRDALTGAYNRRFLMESLEIDVAHCRRGGASLSVVLLDVDHFKAINDRHGHLAGDHALRCLVEIGHAVLRPEDLLARYGGEELAIVLRGAGPDEALGIAERVRSEVAGSPMTYEGATFSLTVSLGVAPFDAGSSEGAIALLAAADAALYAAKRGGRNRVELGAAATGTPRAPEAEA